AIALLQAVGQEKGPHVPMDVLETQAGPVREAVDAQIDAQEQLQEMVSGLEQRYDRMITSGAGAEVPTADDIAAEVEQYLAGFSEDGGGTDDSPENGGPGSPEDGSAQS